MKLIPQLSQADKIAANYFKMMNRIIEVRVLNTELEEARFIVTYDDRNAIFKDWNCVALAEEFNVAIREPMHTFSKNLLALKSTGYSLKNGVYQKSIDWLPQF